MLVFKSRMKTEFTLKLKLKLIKKLNFRLPDDILKFISCMVTDMYYYEEHLKYTLQIISEFQSTLIYNIKKYPFHHNYISMSKLLKSQVESYIEQITIMEDMYPYRGEMIYPEIEKLMIPLINTILEYKWLFLQVLSSFVFYRIRELLVHYGKFHRFRNAFILYEIINYTQVSITDKQTEQNEPECNCNLCMMIM